MAHFGQIDAAVTLPMKYFGTVEYYALMGAYRHVVIDDSARYDKRQKETHRMTIIDTHGVKQLTVPVSKPDNVKGILHWSDIAISRHGQWWHVIAETLASAYGRTPFFEFYIDRFRPFFSPSTPEEYPDVASLCRAADGAVRALLGFDNIIEYKSETTDISRPAAPLPAALHPVAPPPASPDILPPSKDYYQVRRDKFGFVPGLSILDLIFNMGPEAPLILQSNHKVI